MTLSNGELIFNKLPDLGSKCIWSIITGIVFKHEQISTFLIKTIEIKIVSIDMKEKASIGEWGPNYI